MIKVGKEMAVGTNEIWNEFSGALRGFILKRVQDEDAADDILQEAFVKIHKNIGKLEDEKSLRAWLYQITRNTIIDYYRTRKYTVELPETLEAVADEPEENSDSANDLAPCVRALMDRLPERYRESLVLTEFDGLTQKEMGDKLGLSVSGAKSRAQRAKGKMKDLLEDCCQFDIDRRGNILDYQPKSPNSPQCCGDRSDCSKKSTCE